MKVIISQLTPGHWTIKLVSAVAASAGRTTYPTREAAIAAAKEMHPEKQIEVDE